MACYERLSLDFGSVLRSTGTAYSMVITLARRFGANHKIPYAIGSRMNTSIMNSSILHRSCVFVQRSS